MLALSSGQYIAKTIITNKILNFKHFILQTGQKVVILQGLSQNEQPHLSLMTKYRPIFAYPQLLASTSDSMSALRRPYLAFPAV